MSNIISGKKQASVILEKARLKNSFLLSRHGLVPKVCVIIVGNSYASQLYVTNKMKAAASSGISANKVQLAEDVSESYLLDIISTFNADPFVHAIIVQMPLPAHIDPYTVMNAIHPAKDVDGFNTINVGNLSLNQEDCMVPCTALGCLAMIRSVGDDISGMHVVVVGRSNIVGRPLSKFLTNNNATVTLCHSYTKNLEYSTKIADAVVLAVGMPS